MLFYAATIFISAFLLFQIQPLILPWFGGSAAVWTWTDDYSNIVQILQ
jgi:hypothetical protein